MSWISSLSILYICKAAHILKMNEATPQPRQRRKSFAEEVVDDIQDAGQKVKEALTFLWDDLPTWQRDNQYITSGYRLQSNSFIKSFSSLGYLHNETVNIFSHLIPAVGFTILGGILYFTIVPRYPSIGKADVVAFGCFFLGAAVCLGMSATYHAISNHSPVVAKFGNKLDYIGIVFLITGSFVPSIYYGFHCHSHLQELYWTMVRLRLARGRGFPLSDWRSANSRQICGLGLGCATVTIFDRFRTPAWRPYRAGMFVAMGLSAIFPVLHGMEIYGISEMRDRIGLVPLISQGALYIFGAGIYAVSLVGKRIREGLDTNGE